MRVARDFVVGGTPAFVSPERPRIADPTRRTRIAGYLDGGATVPGGSRTDGIWLWPRTFADDLRRRGLAPEGDFLEYIEACGFNADAPTLDERAVEAAVAAALAGPRPTAASPVTYYVRVDDDNPPQAPLSLLRRERRPGGETVEQALWRDLRWHPTTALRANSDDYDIHEVPAAAAAAVIDRWCARWHAAAS